MEGYGFSYIGDERYLHLYLWNHSKNKWDLLVNSSFKVKGNDSCGTEDKTLLFNFSTSLPYCNEGDIYLLAVGPYGAGYSDDRVATDYVAIKHEASAEKIFSMVVSHNPYSYYNYPAGNIKFLQEKINFLQKFSNFSFPMPSSYCFII